MIDPKDLNDFLSSIRGTFESEVLDGNPFFHLVKPTSENLMKYQVRFPLSKVYLIISVITVFPRIIFLIINSLAISLLRTQENFRWASKQENHYDRLIISQFTRAQNPDRDDIFYGTNTKNPNSMIFYLNSTRNHAHKIQSNFIKANKTNVVVNTKSLWIFGVIKIHLKQMKGTLKLLRYAAFNSTNTIAERRLLVEASVFQHARSTIANQIMKVRLTQVILKCKPADIVLMTEGHAHESMILNLRNKSFPNIRILGYQHAPIVPGQFSFWHLLNGFNKEDVLFTCGATTQRIIKMTDSCFNVKVLGSLKNRVAVHQPKDSKRLEVLGVVESTRESLVEFVSLFNFLADSIPSVTFILRIHPGLDQRASIKILKKLETLKNLRISEETLIEDLQRAHIGVFRSSAVGLEGLAFNVLPVHFDASHLNYLNPLEYTKMQKFEFSDPKVLADFLDQEPSKLNYSQTFQEECISVLSDYFHPMKSITSLI
jgi:hypothetical protein